MCLIERIDQADSNVSPSSAAIALTAGQQLPNLKSHEVTALYLAYKKIMTEKKLEGGALRSPL